MKFLRTIDIPLLVITAALVIGGLFIFSSASLGLLARDGASFSTVAFSQIVLGALAGTVALLLFSRIHYRIFKRFAPWIFGAAVLATFLVFLPGLGLTSGGATRWVLLGPISFQPAEFLKFGYVVALAFWLARDRAKLHRFPHGLIPYATLTTLAAIPLLLQPDTGTLLVIAGTGFILMITAGVRLRDLLLVAIAGALVLGALAMSRPYIQDRLLTFVNPAADPLGAGYQIQQSLIAIGSGGLAGRGYGQSIQKFGALPEPINDSIFAVYAEEFGFAGSIILITLFVALAFRGYRIATRAPDYFAGLLVVGIITLIVGQSFLNIGAMLGVVPLTGLPLVFVSQGGTAMLFALAQIGIVLNISRYQKRAQ